MANLLPGGDREYILEDVLEVIDMPSYTHKMWIEEERVIGKTDGLDAIKQMVYKCINTEKGEYFIYPSFGLKKADLFGKPKEYAFAVLTRRIDEALMQDDRIARVDNFIYLKELSTYNNLAMTFTVHIKKGVLDNAVDIENFDVKEVFSWQI